MPRINLLPWREAERIKRQRDFLIATGSAVVAAIIVLGLTIFAYNGMINHQLDRNNRMTMEIEELDKSISEIDGLEAQKERLLARMEIIEQLQRSRPEIVHLFDEMARQLPEGVHLTGMRQTGADVEVRGVAQSSTRVSALMRRVDASEWISDPDVIRVETTEQGPSRQAEFVIRLKQVQRGNEAEEAE